MQSNTILTTHHEMLNSKRKRLEKTNPFDSACNPTLQRKLRKSTLQQKIAKEKVYDKKLTSRPNKKVYDKKLISTSGENVNDTKLTPREKAKDKNLTSRPKEQSNGIKYHKLTEKACTTRLVHGIKLVPRPKVHDIKLIARPKVKSTSNQTFNKLDKVHVDFTKIFPLRKDNRNIINDFNNAYKPICMDKIIGAQNVKTKLNQWYTLGIENQEKQCGHWKPFFIGGDVGCGKSILAEIFLKTVSKRHVICIGDEDTREIIFTLLTRHKNPTAVIYNDIEALLPNDKTKLLAFLKKTPLLPIPFIITSSEHFSQKQTTLKKYCEVGIIYPPYDGGNDFIYARIRDIEQVVGLPLPDHVKRKIVDQSNQDLRLTTMLLEFAYHKYANNYTTDITFQTIFDQVKFCLGRHEVSQKQIEDLSNETMIVPFIHDNGLPKLVGNNATLEDISSVYDMLSNVDMLDSSPSHALHSHATYIAISTARNIPKLRMNRRDKMSFPKVFSVNTTATNVKHNLMNVRNDIHEPSTYGMNCDIMPYIKPITSKTKKKANRAVWSDSIDSLIKQRKGLT